MNSEDKKTLGRNIPQIREAFSDDNKWYFGIYHRRPHRNNDELILFYIEHGGAKGYAKRNANATIQEPTERADRTGTRH